MKIGSLGQITQDSASNHDRLKTFGWHRRLPNQPIGPSVADGHDAVSAIPADAELLGMVLCTRFFPWLDNLQITTLDDNRSIYFNLPAPVFLARNRFKPISVRLEASKIVTRPRRGPFEVLKGGMRHQDGDEHDAILHGKLHASDGFVRWLSYP